MKKAEITRRIILEKSYKLIYAKGYQTTSIDDILSTTQVTKGAFYYHFKNKDEMGIAIINEILKPIEFMVSSKVSNDSELDSLQSIYEIMYGLLIENSELTVESGCPVSNLIQEMTPWNESFRQSLLKQVKLWENQFVAIIEQGITKQTIRKDIQVQKVATYIIAGYFGVRNLGKLQNSKLVYIDYLSELKNYLESLR